MCLAIYQPAGKQIPESHLREGFKNNPDGAGFMYFDDQGNVQTYRTMHFDAFIDEYEMMWALHGQHSPFGIHFRWATHGTKDINNVHPFVMNDHVAVLHNGVIPCEVVDKKMSDTAAFVRDYLGNMPRNWQDNEFLFDMVEQYCAGSKLVIMTSDPQANYAAYIVNEHSGHWQDGVWYSNSSYSCARVRGGTKSAKESASAFDDMYDNIGIDTCQMCGEDSVLDEVCYNCESCQLCWMTEEECACNESLKKQLKVHAMTSEQFITYYNEGA